METTEETKYPVYEKLYELAGKIEDLPLRWEIRSELLHVLNLESIERLRERFAEEDRKRNHK